MEIKDYSVSNIENIEGKIDLWKKAILASKMVSKKSFKKVVVTYKSQILKCV